MSKIYVLVLRVDGAVFEPAKPMGFSPLATECFTALPTIQKPPGHEDLRVSVHCEFEKTGVQLWGSEYEKTPAALLIGRGLKTLIHSQVSVTK